MGKKSFYMQMIYVPMVIQYYTIKNKQLLLHERFF